MSVDLPAPFPPTSATSSPGIEVDVDVVEHDGRAESPGQATRLQAGGRVEIRNPVIPQSSMTTV